MKAGLLQKAESNTMTLRQAQRRYVASKDAKARVFLLEYYQKIVGLTCRLLYNRVGCASDREDMQQYAFMGLVKALDVWDGVRAFEPLAAMWIKGAAKEYMRESDTVPRSIRDSNRVLCDEQKNVYDQTGQQITLDEAAVRIGWTNDKAEKYFQMRISASPALSLEGIELQSPGAGVITLKDTLVSVNNTEAEIMEQADTDEMLNYISHLPFREKKVITDNYYKDQSLAVIAAEMGISASRALQLKERAIIRLRVEMTGSKEMTSVRLEARYVSKCEREIMKRFAKGHEEEDIARAIGVSQRTIQFHTASLRARYKVNHTWQLLPVLYSLLPNPDIRWD